MRSIFNYAKLTGSFLRYFNLEETMLPPRCEPYKIYLVPITIYFN